MYVHFLPYSRRFLKVILIWLKRFGFIVKSVVTYAL